MVRLALVGYTNEYSASTKYSIPVECVGSQNWDCESSNANILTVSKSGNIVNCTATGKGTGTVNVTVFATDGSNKKATCKVKVVNPASAVILAPQSGRCTSLAYKKTLKINATLVQGYGTTQAAKQSMKALISGTIP